MPHTLHGIVGDRKIKEVPDIRENLKLQMSMVSRGSSMSKDLETVGWRVCLGKSLEPIHLTYLVYVLSKNSSWNNMLLYNMKLWFICYLLATQFPFPFSNNVADFGVISLHYWIVVVLRQISVPIFNISQNDLVFFLITPIKPKSSGYMIGESVYILFWTWQSLHGK